MEDKALIKQQAIIEFGTISPGAMIPRNFEGMYRMAEIFSASGLMPKGIDTPAAVFVAVTMGLEVGLSPMQAVQNIAVINGRPSMWGDAVLALVRASGLLEDFDETMDGTGDTATATCTATRKGQTKPIIRKFSMSDAKRAELSTKSGPWKQYPQRMLQMRARSWTLRDGFGDVLKGLHVAEELMDYDIQMRQSTSGDYVSEMITDDHPSTDEMFISHFSQIVFDAGGVLSDLDLFVDEVAKKHKLQPEAVKEGALKDPAKFAAAFKKFLAKQPKTEKAAPAEEPKKLAPINCKKTDPAHGVFPDECQACDAAADCDELKTWEFDQAQGG